VAKSERFFLTRGSQRIEERRRLPSRQATKTKEAAQLNTKTS